MKFSEFEWGVHQSGIVDVPRALLKKFFCKFDSDNDHKLSFKEFKQSFSEFLNKRKESKIHKTHHHPNLTAKIQSPQPNSNHKTTPSANSDTKLQGKENEGSIEDIFAEPEVLEKWDRTVRAWTKDAGRQNINFTTLSEFKRLVNEAGLGRDIEAGRVWELLGFRPDEVIEFQKLALEFSRLLLHSAGPPRRRPPPLSVSRSSVVSPPPIKTNTAPNLGGRIMGSLGSMNAVKEKTSVQSIASMLPKEFEMSRVDVATSTNLYLSNSKRPPNTIQPSFLESEDTKHIIDDANHPLRLSTLEQSCIRSVNIETAPIGIETVPSSRPRDPNPPPNPTPQQSGPSASMAQWRALQFIKDSPNIVLYGDGES
uniref:EF-hand domain-containing protein n=1 Tax=Amorphochlora amoebiformis TaxID=1561963 RepID=A0A7S0H4K7_9EUKA|mmetsp:Transcript_33812/g.54458  ORF Transcript_33812/g.54458 Transcript_33812/m.54458 type:complete len:368 (+) Transcript_33812:555-1658(+)